MNGAIHFEVVLSHKAFRPDLLVLWNEFGAFRKCLNRLQIYNDTQVNSLKSYYILETLSAPFKVVFNHIYWTIYNSDYNYKKNGAKIGSIH